MSLGYAEKISYREDVGKVGQQERFDSTVDVAAKTEALADMVRDYPAVSCVEYCLSVAAGCAAFCSLILQFTMHL